MKLRVEISFPDDIIILSNINFEQNSLKNCYLSLVKMAQIINRNKNNFLKYKHIKENNEKLLKLDIKNKSCFLKGLPTNVALITDPRCNLRCIMCTQGILNTAPLQQLPKIEEKNLIDFAKQVFPTAKFLYLNNAGEPLLSRNLSLEVELAEDFGVKLKVITNGTLFNSNKAMVKRIVSNSSSVVFSFDSPVKKTYESIRINADYDKVVENMSLYQKYRNKLGFKKRPGFGIAMIIMKRNIGEINLMVRLAKDLGADYLIFQDLIVVTPGINKEVLRDKSEANFNLVSAAKLAQRIKLRLFLPALRKINFERCILPSEFTYIDCYSNIHACCITKSPIVGNVGKTDFRTIWNNQEYQILRKDFENRILNPSCRACLNGGFLSRGLSEFSFSAL